MRLGLHFWGADPLGLFQLSTVLMMVMQFAALDSTNWTKLQYPMGFAAPLNRAGLGDPCLALSRAGCYWSSLPPGAQTCPGIALQGRRLEGRFCFPVVIPHSRDFMEPFTQR